MYSGLASIPGRKISLSDTQRQIIEHSQGPLWIIAGPGSGKTEVLVLRCLKLLLVDGVDPHSIMITTFTEKAARNLKDRLINYKSYLAQTFNHIEDVDIFQLRVGTLHSLCNSIMIEYRYHAYKNYRPLDDLDQLLFIYFNVKLVKKSDNPSSKDRYTEQELKFWTDFYDLLEKMDWRTRFYEKGKGLPRRWTRARFLQTLFNRIVEDRIDVKKMEKKGGKWRILSEAYQEYVASLEQNLRVDFAHIQKKFFEFLTTPLGQKYIYGNPSSDGKPLQYVLVDEYQDTNPIQEAIYLSLSARKPHNICVVGDDDQALYRFRGGTVECMISFSTTVTTYLNCRTRSLSLLDNYRSHPQIVSWCNEYIDSFKIMSKPLSRIEHKPTLTSKSTISGSYPAVSLISGIKNQDTCQKFATTIKGLLDNKVINDPSDCVLLMRSTRDSKKWAGPFMDALEEVGVKYYNPRARSFLAQEEIQLALGIFLEVIDPDISNNWRVRGEVREKTDRWRAVSKEFCDKYPELQGYVKHSRDEILRSKKGSNLSSNIQDILYHILNIRPFTDWLDDPARTFRLGQLTKLFEAYSASPIPGYPGMLRGDLKKSRDFDNEVSWNWLNSFYSSFINLIIDEGINDPENDDTICPKGYLPIMTVHQAKGLEFPFVFVLGKGSEVEPNLEHILENEMNGFRTKPAKLQTPLERAMQDVIRFYYVAYSRARYALIMLCNEDDLDGLRTKNMSFGGKDNNWLFSLVNKLS